MVSRRPAGTGSSARATGGSPPIPRGIPAGRAGACSGPIAWWWGRPQAPPEVVAEAELPIRPDGTLAVEIDTALAKAAHPDQDHRYEITAEVTDQSRRTIVGTGTVLVARKPFSVYTWVDRGHYRAGDTIEAERPRPDPRPQAGRRQGDAQAAQDRLRRRAQAGRDARRELGPDARRRRPGPPGDQGRRRRASTGSRRRSTTARATRSRAATCSRSPGRDSTARASASTTWRSSPSGRSTSPARRSGC